jgi:hypothetical protein
VIVLAANGTAFALDDASRERVRPYIVLAIRSDGSASASPSFSSVGEMRRWMAANPAAWGAERRILDGNVARRWLAAESEAR